MSNGECTLCGGCGEIETDNALDESVTVPCPECIHREIEAGMYDRAHPPTQVPDSDAQKLCDWLYRAGYVNREKEEDYDPRARVAWQACYNAITVTPSIAEKRDKEINRNLRDFGHALRDVAALAGNTEIAEEIEGAMLAAPSIAEKEKTDE